MVVCGCVTVSGAKCKRTAMVGKRCCYSHRSQNGNAVGKGRMSTPKTKKLMNPIFKFMGSNDIESEITTTGDSGRAIGMLYKSRSPTFDKRRRFISERFVDSMYYAQFKSDGNVVMELRWVPGQELMTFIVKDSYDILGLDEVIPESVVEVLGSEYKGYTARKISEGYDALDEL